MNMKPTGGAAFPVDEGKNVSFGMTLRDYFAAKAMQGICASGPAPEITDDIIAREAYNIADALLRAREPA